jgi:IS605 OrfB family transposase
MHCATKVYNGLIWHLREQFKQTGKNKITLKNLNGLLKLLPRAKSYYSHSAQSTRDEVIKAYRSFFALQKKGGTKHQAPGFRPKSQYSELRYYEGYGFTLNGDELTLSLGLHREDNVKNVTVKIQVRKDIDYKRIVNLLITYDKYNGLCAHLVVEVNSQKPLGNRKVAIDLGETQALTAIFDDGYVLLYNGRLLKSIRRYWQKIRTNVKPPTVEKRKKSRRFGQIACKESRQIKQLLHIMTTDFVKRCYLAGVGKITIGNLTDIRDKIDYGDSLNQRLHAWPFGKIMDMIEYKAALYGIKVEQESEAYSSQTCHGCQKVKKSNRVSRGQYQCECGWSVQADVNAAANIFETAYKVSPLRSSGYVANPVVLPIRLGWHMVYETPSKIANVV